MRVALKNTVIMIFVTLFGEVGLAVILAMLVDNVKTRNQVFPYRILFPNRHFLQLHLVFCST